MKEGCTEPVSSFWIACGDPSYGDSLVIHDVTTWQET